MNLITSEIQIRPIDFSLGVIMQNRTNNKFDQIVNKGLIISKFRGDLQARKMMENSGLPKQVINRVLIKPQIIRSSDWACI